MTAQTRGLCFSPEAFTGESFSADAFIADCRSRIALESVLADLAIHGGRLHTALLDVANTHFSGLPELSSALARAGDRLAELSPLLAAAERDLDAWMQTLDAAASRLAALEAAAADTRARREALEQLRDALTSLARLEALLRGGNSDCLERAACLTSALSWTLDGPLRETPLAAQLRDRVAAARGAMRERLESALLAALRTHDADLAAATLRSALAAGEASLPAATFRMRAVRPAVSREVTPETAAAALVNALDRILLWTDGDCAFLLQAQRTVGVDFGILAAVWSEVDEALAVAAPAMFSPAIPDAFHAGYRRVAAFLSSLETAHCKDARELRQFRSRLGGAHALDKRWNAKLYFHLRKQEIASKLEASLSLPRRQQLGQSQQSLLVSSSKTMWDCLRQCFDAETTFLPPIAAHFTRLAAQIVARFARWITDGANSRSEEPWAAMTATEFLLPYHDAAALAAMVSGPEMKKCVSDCANTSFPGVADDFTSVVNEILMESATQLIQARQAAENVFVSFTSAACCGSLKQMYGTMSAVRSSSTVSKKTSSQPSFFIAAVFDPLRTLLDSAATLSGSEERLGWVRVITTAVFDKCTEICGELMLTAFRTDDMMSKMASPRSPASTPDASDTERFMAQLSADVQELGRIASRFGIDSSSSESFQRLCRCVKGTS